MLTQAEIDEIVRMCAPDEIYECDVGLIRDLNVEARAFALVVSHFMCPPIRAVEIMCVRADRFEDARHREGSLVETALRGGKLVYRRDPNGFFDVFPSAKAKLIERRARVRIDDEGSDGTS